LPARAETRRRLKALNRLYSGYTEIQTCGEAALRLVFFAI